MEIYFLIGGLGLFTGFLSGLLGIGGGIIMAPLLLYTPPLFGQEPLSIHTVAGLTIVQGLLACLAGALTHRKYNFVSSELSFWMGATIFIAAIAGGAGSRFVSSQALLFLFACLAFAAAFLMLIPEKEKNEKPDVRLLNFNRSRAISVASSVGLLGGLIGQGGSFILIPLMTSYVHIPTRIAIGSNLAIVLLSSLAGFIGKAATGQIQWLMTIPIALTVIPAASFGGYISQKISIQGLRRYLAILIALAALKIWHSLLF